MAIGTAGALIAGTVGSSLIGASSASKAAKAQTAAAADANATQRYIFDESVKLTEPQRQAGQNALNSIQGQLGLTPMTDVPAYGPNGNLLRTAKTDEGWRVQYQQGDNWINRPDLDPFSGAQAANEYLNGLKGYQATDAYKFQLDEGQKSLERMAAARGMRLGSDTLKEAQRYGAGLASQEQNNYLNRMMSVAGLGQNATNSQVQAGQNYANAYGQNALNAGNARASGYMGVNDAMQGGINNAFNIYGMSKAGYFQ